MKKLLTAAAALLAATTLVNAQGTFTNYPLPHGTLHVYSSNDVMADASYIVEGKDGLVTLEAPLFKSGLAEFDKYVSKLGKPVVAEIIDYHEGGHSQHVAIMAEGMGTFIKEGAYAAMMKGFQQSFGDSMVDLHEGEVSEIPFGTTINLAGINFKFNHGPANDFPAAAILIDGTAYLTHWAPTVSHMNNLQISSASAIDQILDGLKAEKKSGAKYFIGSHGSLSDKAGLNFRISYLKTVKKLLAKDADAASFASDLKAAYPGLAGEEGVDALAEALYK